jgi:two-component system, chemotaxis family, CheB/CheR fusion protein
VTTFEATILQQLRDELKATREHLDVAARALATASEQLRRSNEELIDLRNLVVSTRLPAVFLDDELRTKRFTPTASEVFRLRDDDIGRPITEVAPRFDASRLVDDAIAVLRTLEPQGRDVEVEVGDERRPYHMRTLPYRGVDDALAGVVITFVDVSAQRQAEEHRAALGAIVESATEAIWAKKLDGTVTSWNGAAERIYGFTSSEMIGTPIARIVPPERLDELREMHERVARGGRVERVETVRLTRDGRRLDVSVSIAPVRDRDGTILGASSFSHDVSWRKRAESDLIAARDAAESANRAKDALLAVLSHELRTPLTPVLVAAGLLSRDPSLSVAASAKVELIRRNVELEARLIDDLLDVTGLARGAPDLHRKAVRLAEVVTHALEVCDAELGAAGVELDLDVSSDLWVEVDPARMQQVLWNLLRNAARFSAPGTQIAVTARLVGESAVLEVRDQGEGIAKERLEHVFVAFQPTRAGASKRAGGLGLGLAIAKALVEAHGGSLRVESAGPGAGSTFTVTLPATTRAAEAADAGAPANDRRNAVSVLLVEDHDDTLELMRELLTREGDVVIAARNVAEARRACATERLDVVVSDLGLPDGSGIDVARAAQQRSPVVPAIALSGYGMEEDRRRSVEAGFAEHLVKPVGLSDLQAAIRRAVGR